jgi:Flp pilus assembly protein TadG
MTRLRSLLANEKGFAMVYTAVTLTTLLLITGLAVDGGRAYVVKAQLSKAVDGAALGAARNLNSGDPEEEAARIFRANFPNGYLGTSEVTDPTNDTNFFRLETVEETGVNVVTVTAEARLPTTFMRLASFDELTVRSSGEATRRMVDLSLALDVSSSIGPTAWNAVNDAAETFVSAFDTESDRLSLVLYSNGASVAAPMPASRGFNLGAMLTAIPEGLPGGSTNMVEGLYRAWDELRSVPDGQQSSLRVIVLFTDGASNGVPGMWDASGTAKTLRTFDFPEHPPDPDNQTWNQPQINGLFHTQTGAASPFGAVACTYNSYTCFNPIAPWMIQQSSHQWHRSAGIPTSFPLQTSTLSVNGTPQSTRRGLRDWDNAQGAYRAHVHNINNAARNLVEIIANAAREDEDGDYPIRVYTIGMGELVRYSLGTIPETPESILMRIANDSRSADYDDDQLEGRYFYARTAADVGPAFQQLQNQIIRLTK